MVPYQAIFFDFDYTLGDATPSILQALPTAWTSSAGPPPTRMRSVGLSAILWRSPIPSSPGIVTRFTASSSAPISPKQLRPARGKKLSCCPAPQNCSAGWSEGRQESRRQHQAADTLRGILEHRGVANQFEVVLGGDDVSNSKPDLEGLLLAMEQLEVSASQVLYCGDTVLDAEAAQRPDAIFRQSSTGPPQGRIFSPFPMSISLRTCQSYWIGLENRPDDPVGTAAWAGHSRPFCL